MIRAEDVFVVFYPNTPLERVALRGVSLTIQDGEIISLVGNNGSGRSTLLRFFAAHVSASVGRLWVDKTDISCQTISERSLVFASVFYDENIGTAGNLTVLENLAIAGLHHQSRSVLAPAVSKEVRKSLLQQLRDIDFMNMEVLADEKTANISKPHRQVLAMMIAVIKGAKILLVDEHSTGLDKESAGALLRTTEKIVRSNNMTAIMAVGDLKFSIEASDRVVLLSHGKVVSDLKGEEKKKFKIDDIFATSACDFSVSRHPQLPIPC
ncbi:MAG: ATP-binding cassette domain-containing protein [Holosporaceae bacterium]|jgi:putative ABC transport system ATP-binding protein|nr:ATP-binding cassette domain-containing protein [Holosporaceae bacterium]